MSPQDIRLLEIYDRLPPSAIVPIQVAAAVKGVSTKTIRRNYKLILVSDRRVGVRKRDLVQVEAA